MAIVDNNVTEIITKDKSLVPILFFGRIENAKFKRPVEPGDTLIFELELLSPIRRGISHMIARAYVDGKLTTEAEMKAKIVKK